jgi:predicted ferric reductase
MLFLSVAWGLVATTSALGRSVSKATATTVHQFMSTCGLVLAALHVAGLLVDSFMPFSITDVAIPMAAGYRPLATAFGILAMYAVVLVVVTSWLRKRIGTTWWRRTHLLAAPAFCLALLHGVFAGTDAARPWMWWTYLGTGLIVVFLLVVRGLTASYRPARMPAPPRSTRGAQGSSPIGPEPTSA